jgi:hypothetical protein
MIYTIIIVEREEIFCSCKEANVKKVDFSSHSWRSLKLSRHQHKSFLLPLSGGKDGKMPIL